MEIAAALITAGAAYYGNKKSQKRSKKMQAEQRARQAEYDALGKPMLLNARRAIDSATNRYATLATGDRGALIEELGPELAQISDDMQSQRELAGQFERRSGGGAARRAGAYDDQRAISQSLLQRSRRDATDKLLNAGNIAGGLGLNAMGMGENNLANAHQIGMLAAGQEQDAYAQIGQAVGQGLLSGYNWYQNRQPPSTAGRSAGRSSGQSLMVNPGSTSLMNRSNASPYMRAPNYGMTSLFSGQGSIPGVGSFSNNPMLYGNSLYRNTSGGGRG